MPAVSNYPHVMDKPEILIKLIYLADYYCSKLSPAEQAIAFHLFSRSIALGEETCRISNSDLALVTGFAKLTVQRALKNLVAAGLLEVVSPHKGLTAVTYKLIIHSTRAATHDAQRDPYLMFQQKREEPTRSLAYKLTPEGVTVLNAIKKSIRAGDMADYHTQAAERVKEGFGLLDALDAIIIDRYFSAEKKKKYLIRNEK